MRAGLALIVLVLNVFAIISLLGARRGAGTRLRWLAAIVLLPIAGALAWLIRGRARQRGSKENGGHYGGHSSSGSG